MDQCAIEPLLTTVAKVVSTPVPPTLVLTPSMPLTTPGFPLVSGPPLLPVGPGQVYAPPDLVIEATLVTSTHIPETVPTSFDSQGHIIYGTGPTAMTPAIGSQPLGQFESPPLGSGSPLVLHFSIPTDRAPEAQYQRLMELA